MKLQRGIRLFSIMMIMLLALVSMPITQPQASLLAQEPQIAAVNNEYLDAVTPSTGGLTSHFRNWLSANGYNQYDFPRLDLIGGSYGGKVSDTDTVVNQPVIFIHGNSDKALGDTLPQTGWTSSVNYFLSKGYKSSELYATTWGPANPFSSPQQYHSKAYITKIRAFIEAVLRYTGASKVDIVTHSMGVTLTRKAILGGTSSDPAAGGSYNLGSPLTSRIDTFLGIAGGNQGLPSCYYTGTTTPTCGDGLGFYPGYYIGLVGPYNVSGIIQNVNSTSRYEGSYIYSMWSTVDEVIGYGTVVWGQYTCRIPGQNGEVVFSTVPYGHFGTKDQTAYYQLQMVKFHSTK
jgi:triacylglycerol lipase